MNAQRSELNRYVMRYCVGSQRLQVGMMPSFPRYPGLVAALISS